MRISFDLDEVLFVDPNTFEIEDPPRFPLDRIYRERLRKGTVRLIHTLQEEEFEAWVYTSSFRSEKYIRSLFRCYGIRFDGIINAQRHLREVQKGHGHLLPQKVPGYYHIDLHVDDEKSVRDNALRYGYRVMRVMEPDEHWIERVLREAERVYRLEQIKLTHENEE